jgi:hypothetical protein
MLSLRPFGPPSNGRQLVSTMDEFSGNWLTSFGPMTLSQAGETVTGTYGVSEPLNRLSGKARGRRLVFDYAEAQEQGTGWFDLVRDGRFVGEYVAREAPFPRPWHGNRGFDGVWYTTIGTLRLVQDGARVAGHLDNGASFEGRLDNGRLGFRELAQGPKGEGWLALGAGEFELTGEWKGDDGAEVIPLEGRRAMPQPRATWLIVLEAHWQRSLAEREFAFGDMLDEIFARLPHVNVRHRYFSDEASLMHWCAALQFLPEPVVLVITSHGEPEGLFVNGKIIDSRKVIETLQLADSLRLLHFSSCLVARNGGANLANPLFPVSGYTVSVDWMASALTEFTYLDMILGKGLAPEAAAEQVYRLIGFAGDDVPADCPYPAAGFQLIRRAAAGQPIEIAADSSGGGRSFLGALGDIRRRLTGQA